MDPKACPCGSGTTFELCCAPLLAGAPAPTAEALMRSRYTAYVRADIDYVVRTHDPETRGTVDRALTETWARQSQWQGLSVLATTGGGPDDLEGTVEFVARYRARGQEREHYELSRFRRLPGEGQGQEDARWVYVDGRTTRPAPGPVRAAAKPERNAPCPCGSGKKYKKCHGAA